MFERATRSVASSNGVTVVVYEERATSDASQDSPILYSHATGFHGRVFAPVARHLTDRTQITFDYRGYGDTAAPVGWQLTWEGFGDDALAVARDSVDRHHGRRLIGVGHSMGGAGLVMAALRDPSLFTALVLFEPIIFPPEVRSQAGRGNTLADVTRKRRTVFPSYDDAIANFASKPPLGSLATEALEAYVRYGFEQRGDGVHLKCQPEFEAQTYEMGAQHDTWSRLGELAVPVWVMAGSFAPSTPAAIAPRIHELIPRSTFIEWTDRGHFGPLEDPARFAATIRDVADQIAAV